MNEPVPGHLIPLLAALPLAMACGDSEHGDDDAGDNGSGHQTDDRGDRDPTALIASWCSAFTLCPDEFERRYSSEEDCVYGLEQGIPTSVGRYAEISDECGEAYLDYTDCRLGQDPCEDTDECDEEYYEVNDECESVYYCDGVEFSRTIVCNGIDDCSDGRDETYCD